MVYLTRDASPESKSLGTTVSYGVCSITDFLFVCLFVGLIHFSFLLNSYGIVWCHIFVEVSYILDRMDTGFLHTFQSNIPDIRVSLFDRKVFDHSWSFLLCYFMGNWSQIVKMGGHCRTSNLKHICH